MNTDGSLKMLMRNGSAVRAPSGAIVLGQTRTALLEERIAALESRVAELEAHATAMMDTAHD